MGAERSRKSRILVLVLSAMVVICAGLFLAVGCLTAMPGRSHEGPVPQLKQSEIDLSTRLRNHVVRLADEIGERNISRRYEELVRAERYIDEQLASFGYQVVKQTFVVDGRSVSNIEASTEGRSSHGEIVVLGAHYDSADGTPAANDNGSGVAALLEISRAMKGEDLSRTVRFVFFVNEEPPYFHTEDMGSLRYARRCRKNNDDIKAMLSLETIGYFSDEPGSQKYPPVVASFYPDTGNFIAFVGNVESRELVQDCVRIFREKASFPSEGASIPGVLQGVDWSDHWSFWQVDYPALMVTDTAVFRYPHYHEPTDTPDKIDFDRMAIVTEGLVQLARTLAM